VELENVAGAFVCRLLPFTGLAPDIVEAILDGRQPKGLQLAELLGNGPLGRRRQVRSAPMRTGHLYVLLTPFGHPMNQQTAGSFHRVSSSWPR
jgi:hypothetical protein